MASSIVAICNRALALVGHDAIISLTEDNKAARNCNLLWEPVRDEVFRVFPWRCISKRASLARLAAVPEFGWAYYYQLPTDYVRMISPEDEDDPYDVEGDKLLYDGDTAKIQYVYRETNPNKYDSMLISCLALRLASDLAYPLAGSRELGNEKFQQYIMLTGVGAGIDSQEGPAKNVDATEWIDAHE